jgi:deferrochelatase/peroxidase EfeB
MRWPRSSDTSSRRPGDGANDEPYVTGQGLAAPVTRKAFLGGAGAAVFGTGVVLGRESDAETGRSSAPSLLVVSPWGAHQAGITTAPQRFLAVAAFDLTTDSRRQVIELLKQWSSAADELTHGALLDTSDTRYSRRPHESGEARDLGPSRLTLTVGVGRSIFTGRMGSSLGIGDLLPEPLVDLPAFAGERLSAPDSGGDICVQACAEDSQVAFHAIRSLNAVARGAARLRWLHTGFRAPASPTDGATATRNLLGFRDGTNNLSIESAAEMGSHVWVSRADDPSWMAAGTYMVLRRIRLRLEDWDSLTDSEQEQVIGRRKLTGHSLTRGSVSAANTPRGAHILAANPRRPDSGAERILRRSYSYTDKADEFGEIDAGLIFICFQRDTRKQFVPIQHRLAAYDQLGRFMVHTASAVFAMPGGRRRGGYFGETLFGAA